MVALAARIRTFRLKGIIDMTIEERLEKLEKELARAENDLTCATRARGAAKAGRFLAVSLAVLLLAWVVAGAFAPATARAQVPGGKVLRASAFLLEDEKGNARGALMVTKYGPALTLSDEKGPVRVWLGVIKSGVGLSLYDEKGHPRAALSLGRGEPALVLYNEKGKMRTALGGGKDGPGLVLYNKKGKPRVQMLLVKDGPVKERPVLALYNQKGERTWSVP